MAIGEADLMVYMCHDTNWLPGHRTNGIAWGMTACIDYKKHQQSSITEYQTSKAKFGQVSNDNFLQNSPRYTVYF